MKKIYLVITSLLLGVLLISCNKNEVEKNAKQDVDNKFKVVTTIFPEYDWVREILGEENDKFEVTVLMNNGVDLHNFQPTAKDIYEISNCDLFIYVGGESDKWVDRALAQKKNENMKIINLMEVLDEHLLEEELIEGMQEDEEHEQEGHEEEEEEYDEHVWTSIKNAKILCREIKNNIAEIDKENAVLYNNNYEVYNDKLEKLDEQFRSVVDNKKNKIMLFADRFPFRYMFNEYGIKYYAAFKGCSAETEASFETIKFLSDKLSELQLKYVMKIENSSEKIAKAVIENSENKEAEIETMYSIQAVSEDDIKNKMTYITYMEKNLEVINKVLE